MISVWDLKSGQLHKEYEEGAFLGFATSADWKWMAAAGTGVFQSRWTGDFHVWERATGKLRCTMLMNSKDAARRNLAHGQTVLVSSKAGSIQIPIEISDAMMLGVVSIPHGWGHDRTGVQLQVARQHAGQSINDLTDNLAVDALCGTAAFNGTPVTVDALD